jgi:5-(carboxyamino)imidazole ribonucleotide synthase
MNPGAESWVGVLGGGQLGRMLALEARRMSFRVMKWTGGDTSGASGLGDRVMHDGFDSPEALEKFLGRVEVATVEFENVPRKLLEAIERRVPLLPGALAVATCQHREREKTFLASHGIPCAGFHLVDSAGGLAAGLAALPADAILKTAEFGYDGKGQLAIAHDTPAGELATIWEDFDCERAVLEERVPLAAELSVLVVRDAKGGVVTYDAAENLHHRHILDLSIVPARLPAAVLTEAAEIAITVAEALDYVGLLAVEFFLATDGRLLVNEMAPRPHNSGHHTLDACETSQFEQQLRAVCGIPLGSPRLMQPAVMWNLLGDLWVDETTPPDWRPILATPGATLHIYGKNAARPGRKMGHATFTAPTLEEALAGATRCREALGWKTGAPLDMVPA